MADRQASRLLAVSAWLLGLGGLAQAAAGGAAWVDPTQPPQRFQAPTADQATPSEADLELQSILIGNGRRLALIGGKPYRVGDRLGSLTVQNIFRDRVVLQGEGGTRILRLTMSSGMTKAPSP